MEKQKYKEILKYFNTQKKDDDLLTTTSYVSIDHIHEAILIVGEKMQAPIFFYICKSKQLAYNEQRDKANQYKILMNNKKINQSPIAISVLTEYGFNADENQIINEILNGTKKYRSVFPKTKYTKIMENIKRKIIV